jgi:inorganic pyrophosphatase
VVIEVAIGGEPIKYEMDKEAGTLVVDRFLYTPMRYPGNYGFVPHTLTDDGDPIDVLAANTRPIVPGAVINVRPVGVLKMVDDAGRDEKIVAVPSRVAQVAAARGIPCAQVTLPGCWQSRLSLRRLSVPPSTSVSTMLSHRWT